MLWSRGPRLTTFDIAGFPSSASGAKNVSARVTSPRRTPTTGRTEFSCDNSKPTVPQYVTYLLLYVSQIEVVIFVLGAG